MDVIRETWPDHVQGILTHISTARFVAIDFELSGIAIKDVCSTDNKTFNALFPQVQTLQERYSTVKAAAEKYQILQVGITTVEEDLHRDCYVLRPFNINVSPILIDQKLGINRNIQLQSSSMSFLFEHGFDLQKSLAKGVPYLSRIEEARHHDKQPTSSFTLQTPPNSITAASSSRIIAPGQQPPISVTLPKALESYERRSALETLPMNKPFGDAPFANYPPKPSNSALHRLIGLRHVMDGLTLHNNLDMVESLEWAQPLPTILRTSDCRKTAEQFKKLKTKLEKPTTLIGHNVFVDLVNFYHCFIGPLPQDVRVFSNEIHKLFPCVIDTKYLATHHNNESSVRSGLQDLDEDLQEMKAPRVVLHPDHARYNSSESMLHEAGYDSYLTARVAIQLAGKMQAMDDYQQVFENELERKRGLSGRPKRPSEELAEIFSTSTYKEALRRWTLEDIQNLQILNRVKNLESVWKKYGNRLRVNGTVEGVLILQ